ncbi:MAG: hypothetical protein JW737_01000 [Acidobacteria bacterium]|nr:hypothetical protein [Acidobacteriota bacterium]
MKKNIKLMYTLLIIIMISQVVIGANDDCRKEIAGHLKPIVDNLNLYWALELTGALGTANGDASDLFTRNSLFLALEWQPSDGLSFYLEGGLRQYDTNLGDRNGSGNQNRGNSDDDLFCEESSDMFIKLKEAFLQYKNGNSSLSIGLRTINSADTFLMSERLLGLSFELGFSDFLLQAYGGSVIRATAYGDKGWLVKSIKDDGILVTKWRPSKDFGETNTIGGSLSFIPGSGGVERATEDEFTEFHESGPGFLEKIGMTFNYEFGDSIGYASTFGLDRTYIGGFAVFHLFNFVHLDGAIFNQAVEDYKTFGYFIRGRAGLSLGKVGDINLVAGYTGQSYSEGELQFAPAYSNMNIGEVLNLDPINGPFYYFDVVYSLPKSTGLELNTLYVQQDGENSDDASELDLIFKIPLYEGLRVYLIYSNFNSSYLSAAVDYFGIEFRYTL